MAGLLFHGVQELPAGLLAWQVRFRDRNCPCHRYAPIAGRRGPYWTGAAAPAGAAAAVTIPQPHRREIGRCSVTSARISGGKSVTCRRPAPASGAPARSLPQPAHRPGSWPTTSSGAPVISIVAPGWPFGRPGLRPDLPRSDRQTGRPSPSADGGLEEFRELALQLGHLSPQHLKLLPQHQHLGVLGRDHLPQPGIGHAQRSDLIGGRRHTGHKPSMIIVGETSST
jgi:hypothetical protein